VTTLKKIGTTYFEKLKRTFGVYKNKKGAKFYKNAGGRFLNLPKNTKVITLEKDKGAKQARGREVSVRETAGYGQFVYGRMRIGGTYAFLDTNSNSTAYLVSGDGNKSILFTARVAGSSAHAIAVQIVSSGTNPTLSVAVPVANLIVITLESSSGTPLSTREEVLQAVRDSVAANALVTVARTGADGNGIVLPMSITNLNYGGGTTLSHFITLAIHEIDLVESLYVDDRLVSFGDSPDPRWAVGSFQHRVFMSQVYGNSGEEAQPDLAAQHPTKWTSDHKHRGCGAAYVITNYDANTFADGMPELEFIIRGKKCYDPRSGLTVWTQNAALIIADYMMDTRYGMKIPLAKIDIAALTDAANCCDQDVALAAGGTQKRYTIDGVFDTSMTHAQVLSEMSLAMAGDIVYQGGKWFIYPGKWRASSLSINEDDFRGPIRISTKTSSRDSFNGVKGTYIDPSSSYEEKEFPLVKNSTYITEDGRENFQDVNMSLVQNSARAQRIAKIFLEKGRQPIELTAPMSPKLFKIKVCDTVEIAFEKYGWEAKPFEVRDFTPRYDPSSGMGCDVVFRETDLEIYNDSMAEVTYDLAPNTSLTSPYDVGEITGLTLESGTEVLYQRADGTIFSRLKVSWTAPLNPFVTSGGHYVVEYKQSSSSTWINSGGLIPANQTSLFILDVQDGIAYDVRVLARNVLGIEGDWVEVNNHVVLGKTVPPNDVTGLFAQLSSLGVLIGWDKSLEIDLSGYRIKRSATNSWNSATVVENLTKTTQFEDRFRTVGSWYYLIKAVDTSGNESTNAASFLVTIAAPFAVASLDVKITNNVILIDWEVPTSTSFPIAKYRLYKGMSFAGATLLGEAFVTFQAWTEQFAGSNYFWVTAVDTGGNESAEIGKYVTWYNPPNTIQYVYDAINADDTELSSAIFDESFANSFIAPVKAGDSWTQHFSRRGWDNMLDNMVGYDSDAIKALPGLTSWFSPNAEVTEVTGAVSQINDLKNTNHATQGTAGNRPFLSRADLSENLVRSTNDTSSGNFGGVNRAAVQAATVVAAGSFNIQFLKEDNTVGNTHQLEVGAYLPIVSGISYRVSFRGYSTNRGVRVRNLDGLGDKSIYINLTTGAAVSTDAGITGFTATSLGGGVYEYSFLLTATSTNLASRVIFYLTNAASSTTTSYNGDNVSGAYLGCVQVQDANATSTYLQNTNAYPLYRGINGNRAMVFDGSNDNLQTTLAVNPTGGMWGGFAIKVNSLASDMMVCAAYAGGGTDRLLFYVLSTGALLLRVTNGASVYIGRSTAAAALAVGTTSVITWTYDGGTAASGIKIYKNGVQVDTTDNNAGVYTVPTAGRILEIGSRNTGASQVLNGVLSDFIFSQGSTLSDPNRAIIEGYLAKHTTGPYAELEPFIGAEAGFIDEFTDRGWTTLQNKIDAGFIIWIEPSDTDIAYFTRIVDTALIIAGARIEVGYSETILDGSCTVETYISTSLDLITWTDFAEGNQALASNFRFVKAQIRVDGADEMSLVRIGDPTISVGVRKLSLSGRATTSAAGEATVSIGSDFLSLNSIQITVSGGAGRDVYPVFNYSTTNPTSFDVLGWIAGAPGAVDFVWTVEGSTGGV